MKWLKGNTQSSNEVGEVAQAVYQDQSAPVSSCEYCGRVHSANGQCSQAEHDMRKEIARAQKMVRMNVTGKMKK